jgi:exonuclease SbcC
MSGFGAFRDPTTIDFADTDFFALVGPTGSGKSTVIDAVCFALYGSVPRYEDRRLTRYVVTLGASEARVSLTFELEGAQYAATRVVRRSAKGTVSTKEARLELTDSDGTTSVLAGAERELNTKVEELLHLDFDDFTKCVVLPQGEFARFLRAKGDERRELLIKLLNLEIYTEVGRRAGIRAEAAKSKAELHRQRLEELTFATDEAHKEAKKQIKAIDKLVTQSEGARPKIDESLRRALEQQDRETDAKKLLELLKKLSVPADARKHGAVRAAAQQAVDEAQELAAAAHGARLEAEALAKDLPDMAQLQGARDAHDSLSRCVTNLAAAAERAQQSTDQESQARAAQADAEAAVEASEAQLKALEIEHRAEDLAQRLEVGEPCPVCQQLVKNLPKHHVPKALTAAQKEAKTASNAAKTARNTLTAATAECGEVNGTISALKQEQQGLAARVKAFPDLEKLNALLATTKAQLDAVTAARRSEDKTSTAVQTKRLDLEKLGAKTKSLQTSYGAQRDTVVVLEPPAPTHTDLLSDWEALVEWASAAIPVQIAAVEAAAKEAAIYRESAQRQTQVLLDACAELEVPVFGDVVAVLQALAQAQAEAKGLLTKIEDAMAEAKSLAGQVLQLDEEAAVASALRGLLRANKFPEWLIEEALQLLVLDASSTLRTLTNSEFSLDLGEQEFMVIDHANADERRSARTLSGGETFQASLALALALSDQIRNLAAEGAPMLDALFLDEGFGTLDPETLETVAATIENLGQSGRMVGIITHVRELAARVPVRFEVQKGPRTATVERRVS